jgi:hypothetical protein
MTSQPLLAIPDKAANRLIVQLLSAAPPMPPGNRVYHVTDDFECNGGSGSSPEFVSRNRGTLDYLRF